MPSTTKAIKMDSKISKRSKQLKKKNQKQLTHFIRWNCLVNGISYNLGDSDESLSTLRSGIPFKSTILDPRPSQSARINDQLTPALAPRGRCNFLQMLNIDTRFFIYDALANSEQIMIINPRNHGYHSILDRLARTCYQINSEMTLWKKSRRDLHYSSIFGLFKPSLTTFRLCWKSGRSYRDPRIIKWQRVYNCASIGKDLFEEGILDRLEKWQEAMDVTGSNHQREINNYQWRFSCPEFEGPDPEDEPRGENWWILKNRHSIYGCRGMPDWEVLDLKEEVPAWYQGGFPSRGEISWRTGDGIWTHDWENHEHRQEFLEEHPHEVAPGVIKPDLEEIYEEDGIDPEDELDIDGWMKYTGWKGDEEGDTDLKGEVKAEG
jgi:hypothetical protein